MAKAPTQFELACWWCPFRVVARNGHGQGERAAEVMADHVKRLHGRTREVFYGDCEDEATAEFVAHARTDVPALLDELERLRTAIADHRRINEHPDRREDWYGGELQRADEQLWSLIDQTEVPDER